MRTTKNLTDVDARPLMRGPTTYVGQIVTSSRSSSLASLHASFSAKVCAVGRGA